MKLPFALTKNIANDQLTNKLLKKHLSPNSNTIDVGCHKGEILDEILKLSPKGVHFGFEPIPYLFHKLTKKYEGRTIIYPYALSTKEGTSSFNLVTSNPAYSGLIKRKYDKIEKDQTIEVQVKTLDIVIDPAVKIDFIKIDTEGAELLVLQGGIHLIKRHRPIILFEFGLGASDIYGTMPKDIFYFFEALGYVINSLESSLKDAAIRFDLKDLEHYYFNKLGYTFVALPV